MVGLVFGLSHLRLLGLLVVLSSVFVPWGRVSSIRFNLIPRMALGLLHEVFLPVGRPRFLPLIVTSV